MLKKYLKSLGIIAMVSTFIIGCGDPKPDLDQTVVQSATNIEQRNLIDSHNAARHRVGVTSDMTWDPVLEEYARVYAETIANSGVWGHDPRNHELATGENLYTGTAKPTYEKASQAWIDERDVYTYAPIGDIVNQNKMVGHYTQIIWKDTTRVGCAMNIYKTGEYKNWYIVVCKYQTPGNYTGRYPY